MSGKKVKSIKMPSAYVIIYAVIVAVGIWTHFVGGDVVPATLADILLAPITGFKEGISISLFILLIGGFLKVIEKSGALEQGIAKVVSKTKGWEILLIPILMFLISLGGSTYGMSEETLALYPIVVATLLACGYDVITGTATILCGVLSGVSGATINPFYSGFNILIPSTSGLATATIPTMGALSHSLGFSPEVMISTYVGAHFIVGVIPTSGTVMSSLSICKIEYTTWLKLYGKIFLVITVVNLVLLALATNLL